MNIFQKLYDKIRSWKAPSWYVNLMSELQVIVIQAFTQIGKEILLQIKNKIIEVAQQDIPNEKKFKIVFDFSKGIMPTIKDSVLNLIINALVLKLKNSKVI